MRRSSPAIDVTPGRLLWAGILLCLALLSAGCDSTPKIAKLPPDAIILAFGDSLTHGTGSAAGQSYPEVLSGLLGTNVINAGIPGEVTARGLARLPEVLDAYHPDLVILCHGGNDFLRHLDETQTIANLKQMIEMIQGRGTDVILIGVPQFGFVLKPPGFYRQIAAQYRIPYQAEIISDLLGDRDYKSDYIHPNAEGYRLMAQAVYDLIRKAERG